MFVTLNNTDRSYLKADVEAPDDTRPIGLMRAVGANWTPALRQAYYRGGSDWETRSMGNTRALVAVDERYDVRYVSTVSKSYAEIANGRIADVAQDLVDNSNAVAEYAYQSPCLRHFILGLSFGEWSPEGWSERQGLHLNLIASHTGRDAVRAVWRRSRLMCANEIPSISRQRDDAISIRHSAAQAGRVPELVGWVEGRLKAEEEQRQEVKRMIETPSCMSRSIALFAKGVKPDDIDARDRLASSLRHIEQTSTMLPYAPSQWRDLQVLTEWVDHHRPRTSDNQRMGLSSTPDRYRALALEAVGIE